MKKADDANTPFFAKEGFDGSRPRLMIIAPAFPPSASPGAVRLMRLAAVAESRGWQVDAITAPRSPYERYDERQLDSLPSGIRVFSVPMPSAGLVDMPLRFFRVVKGLNATDGTANANIVTGADGPSARAPAVSDVTRAARELRDFAQWRRWAVDAAGLARRIGRVSRPMAIISSGPPQMAHEAARRAARMLDAPLVIDFRDPWILVGANLGPALAPVKGLIRRFERRVCRAANIIVLNTDAMLDVFATRYPAFRGKMLAILNGADPDVLAYSGISGASFTIAQTGDLYEGRDPRPFFRGVAQFLRERPEAREHLRVNFVGTLEYMGRPLYLIAAEEGIGDVFENSGAVTRPEALTLAGRAAVNLVLQQDARNSIPSKVYDYVQFRGAVLALCRPGDATQRLLEGSGAFIVLPDDITGIARALASAHERWRSGIRTDPLNHDGRFDRSRQLQRLVEAIERLGSRSRVQ